MQKVAWCTSCGSLDLVHATTEDIHKCHEAASGSSQQPPLSPRQPPLGGGGPAESEDTAVCRESLEVLSVCLALCPQALEALNKDKAWQTFIIDLLLLCRSR